MIHNQLHPLSAWECHCRFPLSYHTVLICLLHLLLLELLLPHSWWSF
jgi:hypothetical protein